MRRPRKARRTKKKALRSLSERSEDAKAKDSTETKDAEDEEEGSPVDVNEPDVTWQRRALDIRAVAQRGDLFYWGD
ncbi:unnamed protein product [Effrenium voratum]|nr:unnamed protein product [Effrenium voratum]